MYGLSVDEVGAEFKDKLEDFSPQNEAKLRQQLASLSAKINHFIQSEVTSTALDNQEVMTSITQYYAVIKISP
ncbi:hypothetical protein L3081_12120 [Colwellia sp. MSW7]|uniref:Uncharacterized protein n=1 Tax=Colwellia maritima TaxID=2912588 RepID=A0ABS9X1E2_9GAMM|nr:hypothetical protein [Colwellia maritima]MCI2284011.1 hypothetical protein [Colwellia maritima]